MAEIKLRKQISDRATSRTHAQRQIILALLNDNPELKRWLKALLKVYA